MLVTYLYEIGKYMYQNNVETKVSLGFNWKSICYKFLLSEKGEILDLIKYEKAVSKMIPLGVQDGYFSDYYRSPKQCPFLLNEMVGTLLNTESMKWEYYMQSIHWLVERYSNWKLDAFLSFVKQPRLIEKVFSDKGIELCENFYFDIVILKNGKKEPLIEKAEEKKYSALFLEKIKDLACGVEKYCEISGEPASFHMKKHSMLTRDTIRAKLISAKSFDNFYGGKNEKNAVVLVGAETEAYINYAFLNIQLVDKLYYSTMHYFCGTSDGKSLDIFRQAKSRIEDREGKEVICDIKKEFLGKELFLFQYDTRNKGRISVYRCQKYNVKESEQIIQNYCKWLMLSYIEFDKKKYYLPSIKKLISYLYHIGNNDRMVSKFEQGITNVYQDYLEMILTGKYDLFFEKYYLKLFFYNLCENEIDQRTILYVWKKIKKEGFNLETSEYSRDFVAGQLMACAYLIESRYYFHSNINAPNLLFTEKKLIDYEVHPYQTWLSIRQKINKYYILYPNYLKKYFDRIEMLEMVLLSKYDFQNMHQLSGEMYLGFDVEKKRISMKNEINKERGYERCITIGIY